MPFIPHTENDIEAMLSSLGEKSIDGLFSEIPDSLKIGPLAEIPAGMTELEISQYMQSLAAKDACRLCFNGAGAYEHYIPAAVWDIASRGEFMTAYTPYQPEASQGTLQVMYEYQSMMSELMATEVSNASMYDGASALAEAVLMAARLKRHQKEHIILLPKTVHPAYREVVKTIVHGGQDIRIVEISDELTAGGVIDVEVLKTLIGPDITALVIPQPNFFGQLEAVDALTDLAHAHQVLVIAVVNPIAMALLKPPGEWGETGADIICGEGQPLGIPLASGGPYLGFMCTKLANVRQMPGRIAGKTVDKTGRVGFCLTLQAREQHIRRAKATSNICTNQGLLMTAATIHMSLLGYEGLRHVALKSHQMTGRLAEILKEELDIETYFTPYYFHEILIHLPLPAHVVREQMALHGIEAGIDVSEDYPAVSQALLVCVTETKTEEDLKTYVDTLKTVIQQGLKKNIKGEIGACHVDH